MTKTNDRLEATPVMRIVATCLLATVIISTSPSAAAPTFNAGTTIGLQNMDNGYDAYANGNLIVIAHSVDTSNVVVVEISTDAGATWTTVGTNGQELDGNQLEVAAASASNIVIVSREEADLNAIYTTDGGNTWTETVAIDGDPGGGGNLLGVRSWDLGYADGTYVAVSKTCNATQSGIACTGGSGGSHAYAVHLATSTTGQTWSARSEVAYEAPGTSGTNSGYFGSAVAVYSSTSWDVFFPQGTNGNGNMDVRRARTTNGGTSYTTVQINDQFSPLSSGSKFGEGIRTSSDGTTLAFRAGGLPYAAQSINQAANTWEFAQLSTAAVLNNYLVPFSCHGKANDVVILQGVSGSDRLTYAEVDNQAHTDTAIVGQTETTSRPFTAYQTAGQLTVVYGDLTNGRTIVRTTTNADCVKPPAPLAPAIPRGPIFCSARGNANFGYDYIEDVTLDDDPSIADDIAIAYRFTGSNDNYAYSAKSWTPGTTHVSSYFTIEAKKDSQNSIFRSVFSTAAGLPSATAKGNGDDTQHFAEHVEARFKETDTKWNIQVFHVSATNGATTRTPLGQAYVNGNPNAASSYNFTVKTDGTTPKAYVQQATGGNDGAETAILIDLFPGGITLPAYWSNDLILNHWFVGYATDNTFGQSATLRLDPGDLTPLSTCIYSWNALPTPAGDTGRLPPPDGDADGTPDRLDYDDDNDGTQDADDPTPGTVDLPDYDSDGIIDELDPDDDNDGILDGPDPNPQGSIGNVNPANGISEDGDFLAGYSQTTKTWFGLSIMGGFVLVSKRKLDLDPETVKLGLIVIWVLLVAMGVLTKAWLIAAGVVAVAAGVKRFG